MTEKEFIATKEALLEIIRDPSQKPKVKLRATEDLLALIERYESSKWSAV